MPVNLPKKYKNNKHIDIQELFRTGTNTDIINAFKQAEYICRKKTRKKSIKAIY